MPFIEMAVTRDFGLVAEALAVGADDDRRAGVHRVMGQRHHLMRQTAVLGRVAAAVRAEAALEHVHVPQISADLLAHLDAVTRVELAADDGVVLQAEVLLRHVGVALEAARRDDHAAQRAHVAGLAVARDLHADHDAAVRILNQLDGRGLEPHVDLARLMTAFFTDLYRKLSLTP